MTATLVRPDAPPVLPWPRRPPAGEFAGDWLVTDVGRAVAVLFTADHPKERPWAG